MPCNSLQGSRLPDSYTMLTKITPRVLARAMIGEPQQMTGARFLCKCLNTLTRYA